MYPDTPKTVLNITNLPFTVIEHILSHLSYPDINKIRGVSKFFYIVCGLYLKRNIMDVKRDLYKYMHDINNHFLLKRLPLDEKAALLRGYNTLEILHLSLDTLLLLNRHVLETNETCLPIGYVLNGFRNIMLSMKRNMFGSWPSLGMNLHNKIKNFVEHMERAEPKLKNVIPLGVRAMDLIDTLMDARYEICVIYDIPNKFCYITGSYCLADSRFLSYLPDISFVSDCQNRNLTEEESDIIMKYLVLLVNVHNGLLTKSEQYRRDLEFSRRTLLHDPKEFIYFDHWFDSLKTSKKSFSSYRTPDYREVLDTRGEIIEFYNTTDIENQTADDGVKCLIQLKCNIEEAPMQIKRSYSFLKSDIILGNNSIECVDASVFEKESNSVERYGAALKLEIRLPYNNPQKIDLKFTDGESVYIF